jgi:hypothetical protein
MRGGSSSVPCAKCDVRIYWAGQWIHVKDGEYDHGPAPRMATGRTEPGPGESQSSPNGQVNGGKT